MFLSAGNDAELGVCTHEIGFVHDIGIEVVARRTAREAEEDGVEESEAERQRGREGESEKWRVPTWEKETRELVLEEESEECMALAPRRARQFHLIGPNSYCHSRE